MGLPNAGGRERERGREEGGRERERRRKESLRIAYKNTVNLKVFTIGNADLCNYLCHTKPLLFILLTF